MNKFLRSMALIGSLVVSACAPVWIPTSTPSLQTVTSPTCELTLEPLKDGQAYFNAFNLTVVNKSSDPIDIDWNQTYYLYNGKRTGTFIFQGITAEQIKSASIPYDSVPAGGTLAKKIMAVKLIAWAPIRETIDNADKHRFSAGAMPDGENGVLLQATHQGKPLTQKIAVVIRSEAVK